MKPEKMNWRTPYNYDTDEASDASGLECKDPSLTLQSEKDNCDINVIVKRFGLNGQLPTNPRLPEYGDFREVDDYKTALDAVRAAGENFMLLPPDLRARFKNDPQEFLEFVTDPRNQEAVIGLGLATRRKETPPEAPKEAPKAE